MNIVFTGPATVNGERVVRSLLEEIARENGHYVQPSVDRSTHCVVASSADFMSRKGKKLRDADEYGVTVISPDTFLEKYTH
ncbi:MAG: hypothetical protein GQ570_03750 [Helicobacteraceae bacterium]|nr:hypothetical protein [Helicobacteraceae bacterium]